MKKNHIRNSVIPAVLALCAALALSCSNLLEPKSPVIESGKGLVILSASTGDDPAGVSASIRTIVPTETPAFSRYELVFSQGETTVPAADTTGIAGTGVSQELAAGTWTATVRAYRNFTIEGTENEYLAAQGNKPITVSGGAVTEERVSINPIQAADAAPGIFTYKVTFPAGASGTLSLTGDPASPYTLTSGTEVSVEIEPGYYDLSVSLTKDSLSAGTFEKLHVYSGLESKAEFTFTDDDFIETIYLAGTLPDLPGGVTVDGGTVTAYSDAAYTSPIGQVTIVSDATGWVVGVPVTAVGTIVYLKAVLTGSDEKTYVGTGDTGGELTEAGKQNITLINAAPANVTGLSGILVSGAQVTLTWTGPADEDFDHIEITWSPGGTTPVIVAKEMGTWTSSGLPEISTTFIVEAVDTAGNKSDGQEVIKIPDGTPPGEVSASRAVSSDQKIALTWTDPVEEDFDHVEISWTAGGGGSETAAKGTQAADITGLTNGTEYIFTLKTVDALGNKSTGRTRTLQPGLQWTWWANLSPKCIAWGGPSEAEKFVIAEGSGKMAYSANGISWTTIPAGTDNGTTTTFAPFERIFSIAWGGPSGSEKFVAVGAHGKMAYSPNGTNWTAIPAGTDDGATTFYESYIIKDIAWGSGKFVAVGVDGKMARSTDGRNWTAIPSNTIPFSWGSLIRRITWGSGAGKFVAIGGNDGTEMAYSADGISWTLIPAGTVNGTTTTFGTSGIRSIVWGGPSGAERFVAIGNHGKMAYSEDGTNWTAIPSGITNIEQNTGVGYGIAYGSKRFVAVDEYDAGIGYSNLLEDYDDE